MKRWLGALGRRLLGPRKPVQETRAAPTLEERWRTYALFTAAYFHAAPPLEPTIEWFRLRNERIEGSYRELFHSDLRFLCERLSNSTLPSPAEKSPIESAKQIVDRIASLPEGERASLLRSYLRRLIDPDVVPAFYDFDHLDDLPEIIRSRYYANATDGKKKETASYMLLGAMLNKKTSEDRVGDDCRQALGDTSEFVPLVETIHHVRGIQETFTRFGPISEIGCNQYVEGNRQYSLAQKGGRVMDTRDVSLFRGFEADHHLLLRTIIELIRNERIRANDPVLIVGPRYRDEVVFFRSFLGLREAVGLDLIEDPGYVLKGDMHRMDFPDGSFSMVYCAGTLSYSYNARVVVEEFARILRRPGFVVITDAGSRPCVTNFARSDIRNCETLRRLFYRHPHRILAWDEGRTPAPAQYLKYPSLVLELTA